MYTVLLVFMMRIMVVIGWVGLERVWWLRFRLSQGCWFCQTAARRFMLPGDGGAYFIGSCGDWFLLSMPSSFGVLRSLKAEECALRCLVLNAL